MKYEAGEYFGQTNIPAWSLRFCCLVVCMIDLKKMTQIEYHHNPLYNLHRLNIEVGSELRARA